MPVKNNKTGKKKNQRAVNGRNRRDNRKPNTTQLLSEDEKCAARYAATLLNPFDTEPECLPWTPSLRSRKVKVFARGTGATGNSGFGYVIMRPTFSTRSEAVWHSTAGYPGATASTGSGTGKVSTAMNSPYSLAEFGDGHAELQTRLVAAGIRVRYIGTELNRNGRVVALEQPNHENLNGYTFENFQSFDKAKSQPMNRSWVAVTHQPVQPAEYDWHHFDYVTGVHYLGIALSADAGVSASFEWEAYCHFEVIGSTVRGKTRSHTALEMTASAISEIGQAPTTMIDKASSSLESANQTVQKLLGLGNSAMGLYKTIRTVGSMVAIAA